MASRPERGAVPGWCCTLGVLSAVVLLLVSAALSMEPGAKYKPVKSSLSTTINISEIHEVRNEMVVLRGASVNLTCTNKTWNELFFMIWKISMGQRNCVIAHEDRGNPLNTCDGGKVLLNMSSGQPYLHIPRFSPQDEGMYHCEAIYPGPGDYLNIHLVLSVPPSVSAWLEWAGTTRAAVCVAAGGNPAATLTWRNAGNLTASNTTTTQDPQGGRFTVRSTLELPGDGVGWEGVRCVVAHPSWETEVAIRPGDSGLLKGSVLWVVLLLCAVTVLAALGALYVGRNHLTSLRRCRQSVSRPSPEAPPPASDLVDDLQPYACYHQRVNSLYSSSADLLK